MHYWNMLLVCVLVFSCVLHETNGQRKKPLRRNKGVDYFFDKPDYETEDASFEWKKQEKSVTKNKFRNGKQLGQTGKEKSVVKLVKENKPNQEDDLQQQQLGICQTFSCPVGRQCVPGNDGSVTCVCGDEMMCMGHKKRVCGTDGVWYPSHCELHRVACVQSRHIGIDANGHNCQQKHESRTKTSKLYAKKSKSPEDGGQLPDVREKGTPAGDAFPVSAKRLPCTRAEYDQLKASLLKYHCARVNKQDCTASDSGRRALLNSMRTYYDSRNDGMLDGDELMALEHRDHVQRLSRSCHLGDLITFDDSNFDGSLSSDELFTAFGGDLPTDEENPVNLFTTVTTVGGSLEVKCDQSVRKVGWKRNEQTLADVTDDGQIRVIADGSLYIGRVGVEHAANYSCYNMATGAISQIHTLKVSTPPVVRISPTNQFHREGATVTVHCHARAIPQAQLTWFVNGHAISPTNEHYRLLEHNATLQVMMADFEQDSGKFTCKATNAVGSSQAVANVFVDDVEASRHGDGLTSLEQFVVFHRNGLTVYDPMRCLLKHTVEASFNRLPVSVSSSVQTLCDGGKCVWSGAVNVRNKLVYVAQPTLNRIVVLDMKNLGNPIEVITTDKAPSSLQYVSHLDQVWVTCDSDDDEENDDSHVAMVIRAASDVSSSHHAVHTEPVGGHFDKIKAVFLPTESEMTVAWKFGYVLHEGQLGLSKLDLSKMKYTTNIDLKSLYCVPRHVAFLPIGGRLVVNCVTEGGEEKSPLIVIDALTDAVITHSQPSGRPYITPDSRHVVIVRDADSSISISRVDDGGVLEQLFLTYTSFKVSKVTFIPSETGQGYDLYASSASSSNIFYMNLSTGRTSTIASATEGHTSNAQLRTIVAGGEFAEYLMASSASDVMAVSSRMHHVQCRWSEMQDADEIVWTEDILFA